MLVLLDDRTSTELFIDKEAPYNELMFVLADYVDIPAQEIEVAGADEYVWLKKARGKFSDLGVRQGSTLKVRKRGIKAQPAPTKRAEPTLKIG